MWCFSDESNALVCRVTLNCIINERLSIAAHKYYCLTAHSGFYNPRAVPNCALVAGKAADASICVSSLKGPFVTPTRNETRH